VAKGHQKQATPGAFGHDAQPEVGYTVKGREVGGRLHRRGEGRKHEASPIVAQATVVHVEKVEAKLEAKIVVGLARANALVEANRAREANARVRALILARRDIENIVHVPARVERNARIAQAIATYN